MAGRPTSDPSADPNLLDRILKQQNKKPQPARLRIMIAGDPTRPVRSISLPRLLPTLVTAGVVILVLATVILARGSWRANGALANLQGRVHAMVQAADSVALTRGEGDVGVVNARALPAGVTARPPSGEVGRFVVQSVNTGEEVEVAVNLSTGEVEAGSYRQLRHLMRCLRTGAETPLDPRLIDLLYRIAQRTRQKLLLVSGFRAPMFSTAALSYHTRGMAADIRIPGMTPLMARDLAVSMNVRGIGYYPVSGFIHVDVRDDQARWTDYGKDREDGEGAEHGASAATAEAEAAAE
jgi:uncharacterized protein YcbK (DUF882 family)